MAPGAMSKTPCGTGRRLTGRFTRVISGRARPSRGRRLSEEALLRRVRELALDPAHDHLDDVSELGCGEIAPARGLVVPLQATPAAGGCGVLRDEYRMSAVGRLPAILVEHGRRDPPRDHVFGVPADRLQPAQLDEH